SEPAVAVTRQEQVTLAVHLSAPAPCHAVGRVTAAAVTFVCISTIDGHFLVETSHHPRKRAPQSAGFFFGQSHLALHGWWWGRVSMHEAACFYPESARHRRTGLWWNRSPRE